MATIRLIEEQEASAEVKSVYEEIKQHLNLDFVPNVFKALASKPEEFKQQWESFKQVEDYWGKETAYLLGLAVDVTNGCSYCINFDTAMLKQMGYDDAKIEKLIDFIGANNYYNRYVEGLQLESDVTPAAVERRKAA